MSQTKGTPEQNLTLLGKKLKRELELGKESPIGVRYGTWLEDIYQFLLLHDWDEAVVKSLLTKPNPLKEILRRVRSDEAFIRFLDQKMEEKAIEYAMEEESK